MVLSLRRHRTAVAGSAAVAVFLGCWSLLHRWFYAKYQLSDLPVYEGYGHAIDNGLFPYRDFPVEYPPGALPMFVAPVYLGGYVSYAQAFGALMAAFGVTCIVVAVFTGISVRGLALMAVSPLLFGSMVLTRYDFWPTFLLLCAVGLLLHDWHRSGWLALAAAIVAKGFALVVVPVAIVWTLRRRGLAETALSVALGVALVVATVLPFAIVAPRGLWHSVSGQASRPLQIESLAAAFLTTFSHPAVIATHGSLNLGGEGTVAAVTTVVELIVLVALWVGFVRGPAVGERFLRYVAACVCAFVALGKVLSPQFLIWLVPLVALVRGVRGIVACVLLTGALIATQVFFPQRYWEYIFHLHLAWVVLLRDLILVALLVTLSLPARARARSA